MKGIFSKIFSLLVVVALFVAVYGYIKNRDESLALEPRYYEKQRAFVGDQGLSIEVVQNEDDRALGLGGRTSLGENEGMLFVFDYRDKHGIWMRGMKISIDIIWIDSGNKVAHIEKNVSPNTYPKVFFPKSETSAVLELPAGFVEKHGITIGMEFGLLERI